MDDGVTGSDPEHSYKKQRRIHKRKRTAQINLLRLPKNSGKMESTYAQLGANNFSTKNLF